MAMLMLMPLLGQTMEEGTIIKWYKQEGDAVKQGEPLLEVMTDKVNMEVEASESGILRKVLARPDDVVPVQSPIAIIGSADEPIDDLIAQAGPSGIEMPKPAATAVEAPAAPEKPALAPTEAPQPAAPREDGRMIASPAARRFAKEKGVDIAALAGRGTGPGGRIVEKDVLDYLARSKATPLAGKMAEDLGLSLTGVTGTGAGGKVTSEDVGKAAAMPPFGGLPIGTAIPFAGLRKAVAENVARSVRETAPVTLVSEVDMTECVAFRRGLIDEIERAHGVRISFTDIIVKAAARAIADNPVVNSSLVGEKIVIHDRINIGVATAVEGGLVVPVVKDVPAKSLPVVSKEIKDLAARARDGKASGDDFAGGTFTITNLGVYGVDSFDPIITPGQSAILGVGRIVQKPAVMDGRVQIRSMMNLCLTFDHRIMDGAPAAEYLARVKAVLECPYLLFA